MKGIHVPMDDEDYSSLFDKKRAVAEAMGVKRLTWREFVFLMKEVHVPTLVDAGKALNLDSPGSEEE